MYPTRITQYEKYRLSRLVCVNEIVSADYVEGVLLPAHHSHRDAWELSCCIHGQATVCCGNRILTLNAGEAFFVPPGMDHTVTLGEDREDCVFVVSFTCNDDPIKLLRGQILPITQFQQQIISATIGEMMAAFSRNNPGLRIFHFEPNPQAPLGAEQMILCYLEQLLIGFSRHITMRKGEVITENYFENAIGNYQIDGVRLYIREHLNENLSVEVVSREFHYSRTRLSVLFKNATGQTINEYITRKRIEKAKQLLLEGKLSVTQIAREVGYSSPQYFSRRFSQITGVSPTAYTEE